MFIGWDNAKTVGTHALSCSLRDREMGGPVSSGYPDQLMARKTLQLPINTPRIKYKLA